MLSVQLHVICDRQPWKCQCQVNSVRFYLLEVAGWVPPSNHAVQQTELYQNSSHTPHLEHKQYFIIIYEKTRQHIFIQYTVQNATLKFLISLGCLLNSHWTCFGGQMYPHTSHISLSLLCNIYAWLGEKTHTFIWAQFALCLLICWSF